MPRAIKYEDRFQRVAMEQSTIMARRFIKSFEREQTLVLDISDLIQEGMIASLKAIRNFDADLGWSFKSLCQTYISKHYLNLLSSAKCPTHNVGNQYPLSFLEDLESGPQDKIRYLGINDVMDSEDVYMSELTEDMLIKKDFIKVMIKTLKQEGKMLGGASTYDVFECYLNPPEKLIDAAIKKWRSCFRKKAKGEKVRGAGTVRITRELIRDYLGLSSYEIKKHLESIIECSKGIREES